MSDNNGNSGAFLTGFFLGSLVGAVAALMTTPQSGETTRFQIRDKGIELRTQLDGLTSEIQERGKDMIEQKAATTRAKISQDLPDPSTANDEETSAADDEAVA
jgi:gas vesicle protein